MTQETGRTRTWATVLVWTLHAACIAAFAAFAGVFMLMATSLDPMEMVTAGAEPWTTTLVWVLGALGVLVLSALGLLLWHSRRFRPIGVILLALEIGGMIWAGASIYAEYF